MNVYLHDRHEAISVNFSLSLTFLSLNKWYVPTEFNVFEKAISNHLEIKKTPGKEYYEYSWHVVLEELYMAHK